MLKPKSDRVLKVFWSPRSALRDRRSRLHLAEREQEASSLFVRPLDPSTFRNRDDFLSAYHIAESRTTYAMGFDVPSIFHSSLAVEIGLFVKVTAGLDLSSKLPSDRRKRLREFRGLIDIAKEEDILGPDLCTVANESRLLRNVYVHYYNALYLGRRASDDLDGVRQLLADPELTGDPRIASAFRGIDLVASTVQLEEIRARVRSTPIRDMSQLLDPEQLHFFEQRARIFNKWLLRKLVIEEGLDGKEISDLFARMASRPGIFKYDRKRYDALDSLKWSCQVLEALGIFS